MVYYVAGILLILIGMYAVLTKKNIIKIVIGLSIIDSGINLLLIAIGYVKDATAPIFSNDSLQASGMVDPVPQALVLTAIVIGLGVTAVALALVIRLYDHHKTLNINKIRKLKW
jgi:multicomponent Na+:H+ antiporter subunit C